MRSWRRLARPQAWSASFRTATDFRWHLKVRSCARRRHRSDREAGAGSSRVVIFPSLKERFRSVLDIDDRTDAMTSTAVESTSEACPVACRAPPLGRIIRRE